MRTPPLFVLAIIAANIHAHANEPQMQSLTFVATEEEFANPERGFLRYTNLTNPWNYASIRRQGQTLVYGRVEASDFRDAPLSGDFLDSIQAGFDAARRNGLKVKFRLAYNDGFEPDAPLDVVLTHIEQLSPIWHRNRDVLFNIDAGFIGAWGEWHASTNGLGTPENRATILRAILDALPANRSVGLRYPAHKREFVGGSPAAADPVLDIDRAFDGSDLARIGHLNDCFLSSPTDVGTYRNVDGIWPRSRELEYVGGESRFTIHGGETCAVHALNESAAAIREMEQLHTDYLNLDYHPDVIQRWKDEGRFEEIQRRLGYRFELVSANLPDQARSGGTLPLRFELANVGFGELFNARPVQITLRHSESQITYVAQLAEDPRFWSGGGRHGVDTQLVLPDLPEGNYDLGISLPDDSIILQTDPRYSIRFANADVWEPATGVNWLTNVRVSDDVSALRYSGSAEFRELRPDEHLQLLGDFDTNGQLDVGDLDRLTGAIVATSSDLVWDMNRDGTIDVADHEYWVSRLRRTIPGDASLDGQFTSADLVLVFRAGLFEVDELAGWSEGDWTGDQRFSTADLVAAFRTGNYEQPRTVPEPAVIGWCVLTIPLLVRMRRATAR